jgi:hypothetical protein
MVMYSTLEHPTRLTWSSHLSIEIGHLYSEEFQSGPDSLHDHFRRVAPAVARACRVQALRLTEAPRISTCFLVDDSFLVDGSAGTVHSPAEVLPDLMKAAARNGVPIDYLVRKSACANAGVWQLLRLGLVLRSEARPRSWDGTFPAAWHHLPQVLRLNESAAPFTADRAISVLNRRFGHIEHMVRGMLSAKALARIDYIYTE